MTNGMGWLFLVLALLLAGMASRPRLRRSLTWGRSGSRLPMSAFGLGAWIVAFLVISAAAFGLLPFAIIFLVVPFLAIAGMIDSHRHRRKRQAAVQRTASTSGR